MEHIRKYIKMTKHTNKNKEVNRLCVTFEHPEILQEFNNYFYERYNTVRGYRLKVIEELISNFNETQSIQKETPQIIQENQTLHEEKQQLEKQITTATNTTQKHEEKIEHLNEEIETLKQQLKQYQTLQEEKIRLEENNKKQTLHIDNLTNNNELLQKQLANKEAEVTQARNDYRTLVTNHEETIKKLTNKHETTLKQITTEDNKIIKDLQDKMTTKDNKYTHLEERNHKLQDDYNNLQDTINKVSYAFGSLQSMSLLDRILKNYPEEIRELKP